MKNSMQSLIKMFPHFFDKSETSNFFKSQSVTNNVFKGIFQSISDVSDSFRLRKRCCIWKEQSVPYDYVINFVVNYPQLKSVKCYKNDTLIYMEEYLEEDNVSSFIYSYDSSEDNTIVDDNSEDNEEENQGDDSEIEIPIIPEDTFHIIAESYDEIIIKKGFPENDELTGDIYDHDTSLDEIGALNGIPRKTYIPTEDYANTEPTYNNRLTEDDYHYMNRIINYVLRVHDTPLPVLEIWKIYGIFSDMINREEYLLKMFDETMHPYDEETGLVGDWTPMPWEHKDKLCNLTPDLGRFFFVSANTLLPVKNQSVIFNFQYLNMLAEKLTGDYNVTIYLNDAETPLTTDYTSSTYTVTSDLISDDEPNIFRFEAYIGQDLFATEELTVTVRGCNSADWYVNPSTGDDTNDGTTINTPFRTINKALTMVNGEQNLIVLTSGTYTINNPLSVNTSSTVLGCGNAIIENTTNYKFFKIAQNQRLNLQDLTLTHDTSSEIITNHNWINNNKNNNPLYVVISEGANKTLTYLTLNTDKSVYTIGETVQITGLLTDDEETTLSGKSIKIYVNNELVDTVTTLNNGTFSKNVTVETSGNVTIRAVFDGDEDYRSSMANVNITVNKKPVTITFSSNKASYVLGETITLTGTLKQASTNIGSASIEIYDGETLLDTVTTLSNGTFSKTITAETVESKSFHAVYNGNATYESATSSNVNVTITKRTPTISLLTSKSSVITGDSYILSGALLYNGTGVANASVKLYQGQSVIDTITTANDGTFSKTITSTAEGTFTYHVVFDATTTYTGVTSGNVTVTVSDAPSFDAIELTSDKDILSAYDEESATLTAQLMSGTTPVAIAGETVTFEVRKTGDDSLVETLTADTNSSGVATVSYLGKGTGNLYIQSFSSDRIIVSEISVADCVRYDSASSNRVSDYTMPSGLSMSWSTDHYNISSTSQSKRFIDFAEIGSDDFEFSALINASNRNMGLSICNDDTHLIGLYGVSSGTGVIFNNGGGYNSNRNSTTLTNNQWYKYTLIKNDSTYTGTIETLDGTVFGNWTQTVANFTKARLMSSWNVSIQIKQIKVKRL